MGRKAQRDRVQPVGLSSWQVLFSNLSARQRPWEYYAEQWMETEGRRTKRGDNRAEKEERDTKV